MSPNDGSAQEAECFQDGRFSEQFIDDDPVLGEPLLGRGERAHAVIEGQGVWWGPRTDEDLIQVEKPIDFNDARDRA